MSMDYQFAGSSSYEKFDKEIIAIAERFGGKLNLEFQKRINNLQPGHFYIFGITNVSEEDRKADKFVFPDKFDRILAHWLNHPYDILSVKDTKHIWRILQRNAWMRSISPQIYSEMYQCVENNCGWYIF